GDLDALLARLLAVPARQAVAAEAGAIHQVDVLHVGALLRGRAPRPRLSVIIADTQGLRRRLISSLVWRIAARTSGTFCKALSSTKSWIWPLYRVAMTSTPASLSLLA